MKKIFLSMLIATLFVSNVSLSAKADQGLSTNLELMISSEEIHDKIVQVADQINREYKGKDLTLVMIMKGSLCLVADLMREIKVPCKLEFIQASSYGMNGTTAGSLSIFGFERLNLVGKDILLVDDIFETGRTMEAIAKKLYEQNPNSIKTLVLLLKNIPRKTTMLPDYTLFEIEDRFVIGYGLDYKEYYRGLSGIYILNGE